MMTITLHDTESEEIIGMVTPKAPVNFPDFENIIRKSFIDFHKSDEFNDGDYSIEDFVDFHNTNHPLEIDWIINDFIQLSDSDIEIADLNNNF